MQLKLSLWLSALSLGFGAGKKNTARNPCTVGGYALSSCADGRDCTHRALYGAITSPYGRRRFKNVPIWVLKYSGKHSHQS